MYIDAANIWFLIAGVEVSDNEAWFFIVFMCVFLLIPALVDTRMFRSIYRVIATIGNTNKLSFNFRGGHL